MTIIADRSRSSTCRRVIHSLRPLRPLRPLYQSTPFLRPCTLPRLHSLRYPVSSLTSIDLLSVRLSLPLSVSSTRLYSSSPLPPSSTMPLNVSAAEKQELLVTYAALILNDEKIAVTAENIQKLITAANGEVEPYWPKLFASLLEGRDISALLLSSGGGGGGGGGGAAPAGGAAAGGAAGGAAKAAEKEPEKEKEKSEESEADMGFSLFD